MQVVFSPEAANQIADLYLYLADASSQEIAGRYIESVITYCEGLAIFPHRGALREDVRPGLRVTHHRGKTVIAFAVHARTVEIVGVFHGGRDYDSALRNK